MEDHIIIIITIHVLLYGLFNDYRDREPVLVVASSCYFCVIWQIQQEHLCFDLVDFMWNVPGDLWPLSSIVERVITHSVAAWSGPAAEAEAVAVETNTMDTAIGTANGRCPGVRRRHLTSHSSSGSTNIY